MSGPAGDAPGGRWVLRAPGVLLRDLYWEDLRQGAVSMQGLEAPVRLAGRMGLVLLLGVAALIPLSGLWRGAQLLAVPDGQPGRGTLVPAPLLPVTLFLLAVACAFMLAGALRCRPVIAAAALVPFLGVAVSWSGLAGGTGLAGGAAGAVGWVALGAIPVVMFLRRRARVPQPALDLAILLVLSATVLAAAERQLLDLDRAARTSLAIGETASTIVVLAGLTTPFLYFLGVDIADFACRASGTVSGLARRALPRPAVAAVSAALAVWLVVAAGTDLADALDASAAVDVAGAYAGALGVVAITALAWGLTMGRPRSAAAPDDGGQAGPEALASAGKRVAMPLVLPYAALVLGALLVLLAADVLDRAGVPADTLAEVSRRAADAASHVELWQAVVDVALIALAVWLRRRGHRLTALYVLLVGALNLWSLATQAGRPLGALAWGQEQVNAWIVVAAVAVAGVWLARGSLTPARLEAVGLLLVLAALLGQIDLLEDPFAPLVGFSGIAIITVGLVWDVMTFGPWVNRGSPGAPRESRLFIYLGYALFGVCLLQWALATHSLGDVDLFTGDGAVRGFMLLGLPLVYATAAATLSRAARRPGDPGNG